VPAPAIQDGRSAKDEAGVVSSSCPLPGSSAKKLALPAGSVCHETFDGVFLNPKPFEGTFQDGEVLIHFFVAAVTCAEEKSLGVG
jgi:hypothetical protein